MSSQSGYIPALGSDRLTPLYDSAMASIFQERRLRLPLVEALHLQPGARILDVGRGTGTLTVLIAQRLPPGATPGMIVGMDIDPQMMVMAQAKAAAAKVEPALTCSSADRLPYADKVFDAVVCSLMLHHLAGDQKQRMLAEAQRVLMPGGGIFILDFGPVGPPLVRSIVCAGLGRFEHIEDNLAGRVPQFMATAGFVGIEVVDIAFGGVMKLFQGRKPKANQ